ncbi:hypothetical protein ILUMI_25378 [Ignelater luminosus]|uniref:Reverse transcriptase domain-containing protein n=1 Tax=Ignelater luminosus TaxID=2038154 RepID=A0A8K0CBU3_IGNLU|nr:hypothetical protein ILUMI_25378 [Ignelater luminosus]
MQAYIPTINHDDEQVEETYDHINEPIQDERGDENLTILGKARQHGKQALGLRLIIEEMIRKDKRTYVAFIDIEKAFDNVEWKRMFQVLKRIGVKYKDRRIIHNIYQNQLAGASYLYHYSIHMEEEPKEVREITNMGIKIHGEKVEMLCYVDDTALLAENERDLKEALNQLQTVLKESYDIKINHTKTRIIVCGKQRQDYTRIRLEDQVIDEVNEFCYLGSTITTDGRCKQILSAEQNAKRSPRMEYIKQIMDGELERLADNRQAWKAATNQSQGLLT